MKVSVKDVTESVLRRLNENPSLPEEMMEYGEPWMDVRVMIEGILPEVAERVIMEADAEEIREWLPLGVNAIRVRTGEICRTLLPLPDDYLRMVYIRMSDWSEEVSRIIDSRSDVISYRRLREKRRGYGRSSIPAVAQVFHDRRRALEIFGSVEGSRLAEGGYLPKPERDGEGNLLFPSSLKVALVERMAETIKRIRE